MKNDYVLRTSFFLVHPVDCGVGEIQFLRSHSPLSSTLTLTETAQVIKKIEVNSLQILDQVWWWFLVAEVAKSCFVRGMRDTNVRLLTKVVVQYIDTQPIILKRA